MKVMGNFVNIQAQVRPTTGTVSRGGYVLTIETYHPVNNIRPAYAIVYDANSVYYPASAFISNKDIYVVSTCTTITGFVVGATYKRTL